MKATNELTDLAFFSAGIEKTYCITERCFMEYPTEMMVNGLCPHCAKGEVSHIIPKGTKSLIGLIKQ